jgi:ribosomal RNA-processing protein 8
MFGKINLLKGNPAPNAGKLNNSSEGEGKLQSQFAPIPKNKKIKKDSHLKLQEKYSDLQGAKFRLLNEMLYTNDSVSSVGYFRDNKEDFQLYHEGYRHQASKWEYRPVD